MTLPRPENATIYQAIGDAKKWSVRPLSMVSMQQPSDKWETLDFILVKAYERLESFKCPLCGGWVWECSTDVEGTRHISYNVKEVHCRKTQALERFEDNKLPAKERTVKGHHKRKWGLWHHLDAGIPERYKAMFQMPRIEDMFNRESKIEQRKVEHE